VFVTNGYHAAVDTRSATATRDRGVSGPGLAWFVSIIATLGAPDSRLCLRTALAPAPAILVPYARLAGSPAMKATLSGSGLPSH
jgi:hypothetical protein